MKQKLTIEMLHGTPVGVLFTTEAGEEVRLIVKDIERHYGNERRPLVTIKFYADVEELQVPSLPPLPAKPADASYST